MQYIIVNNAGQFALSETEASSYDDPDVDAIMNEFRCLPNPELASFRRLQDLIIYVDNETEHRYYAEIADDFVDDPDVLFEVPWFEQETLAILKMADGILDRASFDEAVKKFRNVVVSSSKEIVSIEVSWFDVPRFGLKTSQSGGETEYIKIEDRNGLFERVCELLS